MHLTFCPCTVKLRWRANFLPQFRHSNFRAFVWHTMCDNNVFECENFFSHNLQAYGRSPVCRRLWTFNDPFVKNCMPHIEHLNCLSSMCVRRWFAKFDDQEKRFAHTVHENGFSPVWHRICELRSLRRLNWLRQISQLNNFSVPEWSFRCVWRLLLVVNSFEQTLHEKQPSFLSASLCVWRWMFNDVAVAKFRPHNSHTYGFSPEWQRKCVFKLILAANDLGHTVHLNGRSPVCNRKWIIKVDRSNEMYPQLSQMYLEYRFFFFFGGGGGGSSL